MLNFMFVLRAAALVKSNAVRRSCHVATSAAVLNLSCCFMLIVLCFVATMHSLKVVIIGGGIAGLTAGLTLRQHGFEVVIYERVQTIRPAGAGLSLWSNAVKVLDYIGLGEKVAAMGGQMDRLVYNHAPDDRVLSDIHLEELVTRVGERPYPVSRTAIQQLMAEEFGEEHFHLGMKCVSVREDENGIEASFSDGSRVRGDILLGADGIHSTIRAHVLGNDNPAAITPYHYTNWNGIVDASDQLCPSNTWIVYVGQGQRASMMPIGDNKLYYFFGSPLDKGLQIDDVRAELSALFKDWPSPVQKLIETLDVSQLNRLEIHDLDPLPNLVRGRIALIGDAAHSTTPTLGQGACMAMEDAIVLCERLTTTNISVADALQRYEADRKERVHKLVLKARKRSKILYSKDAAVTSAFYESLANESPSDVIDALEKLIVNGPLH